MWKALVGIGFGLGLVSPAFAATQCRDLVDPLAGNLPVVHSISEIRESGARIVFVPDVHAEREPYEQLGQLLETWHPQWIVLEHPASEAVQASVDAYVASKGANPEVTADLLQVERSWQSWNRRSFLPFLEKCRILGVQVILPDRDTTLKGMWPTKKEGMIYRNRLWARAIPSQGNGMVFGGAAHFLFYQGQRVQDELKRLDPLASMALWDAQPSKSFALLFGLFSDSEFGALCSQVRDVLREDNLNAVKYRMVWIAFDDAARRQTWQGKSVDFETTVEQILLQPLLTGEYAMGLYLLVAEYALRSHSKPIALLERARQALVHAPGYSREHESVLRTVDGELQLLGLSRE